MNIRSIDLQVLIPRATDASKAQQIADHQIAIRNDEQATDWRHLSDKLQSQVQATPKDVGVRIDKDGQRQGRQKQENKKHAKDHGEDIPKDNECLAETPLGHLIDIKT
jgi:hypothetical protein